MLPTYLSIEGKSLPLVVRKNLKVRRLILRVCLEEGGRVVLTTPRSYSEKQVLAFIDQSKPWLTKQIVKSFPKVFYVEGMILPILGRPYELRHKSSKAFRSWWGEDHLLIHAPPEKLGQFVEKSLHQIAKQFLHERTMAYANRLEKTVNRITLKDTRSRWGSCTPTGNISYSWRLIFAPEQVADYVCAHEVAHLLEMNHSPQFWNIVKDFCPEYKTLRHWLRQNGKSLFQYGA